MGLMNVYHLGGSLELKAGTNRTDCLLSSPALIFLLLEKEGGLEVFLEEAISFLAREHARCGRDDEEFRRT